MLLCLIGGAMRAIGPSPLLLQVLLIGTMSPQFGLLLNNWLDMEERFTTVWTEDDDEDDGWDDDDDDEDDDEQRSGWLTQHGPVWWWREVTQHGSVLVLPFRWYVRFSNAALLRPGRVWTPGQSQVAQCPDLFFELAVSHINNHALLVALS